MDHSPNAQKGWVKNAKAHQLTLFAGRKEVAGYENPGGFCSVAGSNWRGLRQLFGVLLAAPNLGGDATARSAIFKPDCHRRLEIGVGSVVYEGGVLWLCCVQLVECAS
jgi:hypothetical protein